MPLIFNIISEEFSKNDTKAAISYIRACIPPVKEVREESQIEVEEKPNLCSERKPRKRKCNSHQAELPKKQKISSSLPAPPSTRNVKRQRGRPKKKRAAPPKPSASSLQPPATLRRPGPVRKTDDSRSPVPIIATAPSMSNRIKTLQARQAKRSSTTSGLSSMDRSELKCLWRTMRAEEEGSRNRLAADSEPDFEPVEITPLCQTNDIFYANITYADLDQRLDILGFQRSEKTQTDGNCFFHAIKNVGHLGLSHHDLRSNVVDFYQSELDREKNSIFHQHITSINDIPSSYLSTMRKDGEHVDGCVVAMTAKYLRRDIVVIYYFPLSQKDKDFIIFPGCDSLSNTLDPLYTLYIQERTGNEALSGHYQAIHPSGQDGTVIKALTSCRYLPRPSPRENEVQMFGDNFREWQEEYLGPNSETEVFDIHLDTDTGRNYTVMKNIEDKNILQPSESLPQYIVANIIEDIVQTAVVTEGQPQQDSSVCQAGGCMETSPSISAVNTKSVSHPQDSSVCLAQVGGSLQRSLGVEQEVTREVYTVLASVTKAATTVTTEPVFTVLVEGADTPLTTEQPAYSVLTTTPVSGPPTLLRFSPGFPEDSLLCNETLLSSSLSGLSDQPLPSPALHLAIPLTDACLISSSPPASSLESAQSRGQLVERSPDRGRFLSADLGVQGGERPHPTEAGEVGPGLHPDLPGQDQQQQPAVVDLREAGHDM